MADPEEDSPEYWNQLAVEIVKELAPEVDWMVETLTLGGIVPGEVKPTLTMLKGMQPPLAMAVIGRQLQNPLHQADGVTLFKQYLQGIEKAALKAGAPPIAEA